MFWSELHRRFAHTIVVLDVRHRLLSDLERGRAYRRARAVVSPSPSLLKTMTPSSAVRAGSWLPIAVLG